MLRKYTSLALVAAAGALLSVSAHAQVIVQNFTIPTQAVPFTQSNTFNLFDTNLGTLTGVTFSLTTSITAEVDVFNLTGTPQNFSNATASIPVKVTGPDATSVTTTAIAGPFSGSVPAPLGIYPFKGLTGTGTNTTTVSSLNFGSYEGVGTGTAQVAINGLVGTYSGQAGFGVGFGGSAVAGGTFTLTYNYTLAPITPEPGSSAFLVAGMLGSLGFVVRRRRSRK